METRNCPVRAYFPVPKKSDEERRYFEVIPAQRGTMALPYFGLITVLALGMKMGMIPHETPQEQ